MTYRYATWRTTVQGIPRDRAARERKLEQINADLRRPDTPEEGREDEARIARKIAQIQGAGLLV